MVDVEGWARIRAMSEVEKLSIKEITRRTGHSRNTVRRALRDPTPPRYERPKRPSKLDPYKPEIHRLVRDKSPITSERIREEVTELGYTGGRSICDAYIREIRPVICPPRTYQQTDYRPGEICQFDIWEPSDPIPVGASERRDGYVVTCRLGYSRFGSGTLIFTRQTHDILWAMSRCLARFGYLAQKLVWDRESAIHAGGGRPTDAFAAYCGALGCKWQILGPGDAEAKGLVERMHGHMETNFEPAREFSGPSDFQSQLDDWFDRRQNARTNPTTRQRPCDRLVDEAKALRALPEQMPDTDRRFIKRVPLQPYLDFDTCRYSLDPRFAGQRVEIRISSHRLRAHALGSGELVASHRRRFDRHQIVTDPAHQRLLDELRCDRQDRGRDVEVQAPDLARYEELVGA